MTEYGCEWNPETNQPALSTEPKHGEADWCIGYKCKYQVCTACSKLPVFKRLKKKWIGNGPAPTETNNA